MSNPAAATRVELRRRLDQPFVEAGDVRPGRMLRALVGPLVVWHLLVIIAEPYYRDRFTVPFFDVLIHPSKSLHTAMLWIGVAAGALMIVPRVAHWANAVAFAVVTYNLLLDQLGFHHNRAFLVLILGSLALLGPAHGDCRRPIWPILLLRVLVASVYLASGVSKALNPSWRSGTVLHQRVLRYELHYGLPFPEPLVDLLTSDLTHRLTAPATILTELAIGLGLWSIRTRSGAVLLAVVFHVAIELTSAVQIFSYAAIAALVIWWTPGVWPRSMSDRSAAFSRFRRLGRE